MSENKILKSPWLSVRKVGYEIPQGKVIDDFYVVDRPDFVVIVARTDEKKFILVSQYRHGIEREILNFPMGFVEQNEPLAETAVRELSEETGFSGGTLEFIGDFFLAPPFMRTTAHVYFADHVHQSNKTKIDSQEINAVTLADQSTVERFIQTSTLSDLVSICSYLLVKNKKPLN